MFISALKKMIFSLTAAAGLVLAGNTIAGNHGKQQDIVDTAIQAGSFTTLVKAIQAADLEATLKSDGPFTVFAPTDEAFSKIPVDQLDALLADKDRLTSVLTYHVVPGSVMAAEVMTLTSAETVNGQSLMFDTASGVKVDSANVIQADIAASNGVIHVVDSVILPKEMMSEE